MLIYIDHIDKLITLCVTGITEMATRTAPLFTAPATSRAITIHLMDASGDTFAARLVVAISATLAAIEAWISLYQAMTNATVYKVTDELIREGEQSTANATAAYRASVESGINIAFKDTNNLNTVTHRIVAPVAGVMQGNNDIPNVSATDFQSFLISNAVILPTHVFKSAQYTSRRERSNNPRLK